MTQAAQRGHLLGSTVIFPLEVEQRTRGDFTRALVQGPSALDKDLCTGHDGLRDALTAEMKAHGQPDAKKALAMARDAYGMGMPRPRARRGPAGPAPPPRGRTTPAHCASRRDLGPVRPGLQLDWWPWPASGPGNLLGTYAPRRKAAVCLRP